MKLGEIQSLRIVRFKDFGAYLGEDGSEETVLLPKKEVPETAGVNDVLKVFLYKDSEDRLIATTREPKITLGKMAALTVREVSKIGGFLDWGLEKDLFLPYREMVGKVEAGDEILVRLYIDKSGRLAASMRGLYRLLSTQAPYQKGDSVSGRIYEFGHDFGTFVAVDDKYSGMIPKFEKTSQFRIGDVLDLHVTGVKEDGKLDVSLRKSAAEEIPEDAQKILDLLDSYAGVLPFTEKAKPEVIFRETGLSKNAFKRAVGHLYKERKITLEGGKIRKV
ncbi:MAG: S1-like domain-containing RNA-binding protein [Lachnospiraceae bacterium]|nr:S1-like domain-containing RNA-binding protein [Lachnospiraceae bacterium]